MAETVDKRLMERLAESFEHEARAVDGGDEAMTPLERRLRTMHARCFRACADRLRHTLTTGKVPRGLH